MINIYYRKHGQLREKELIASFQYLLDAEKYLDELRARVKTGFYKDAGYFFLTN